ncbi:MAG: alpha/beta hydrolase [Nonomuraea muscovyensis]|nr:alpha/beta hydrolase [Nonomuraea muscovyensis]
MPDIELSAGRIDYTDTGGPGETVVLVPGLAFDDSVWQAVVDDLRADFRVVVPVLPIGSHRRAMRPEADLSARGVADVLAEFMERLDLRDVTLVQNDAGTAQLLVGVRDARIGRLVLTSCEALENYPPGIQGRTLHAASRIPGGLFLLLQSFRVPFLVRMPSSLGGMAKRPIPYELVRRWYTPLLTDRAVRRDFAKFCGSRSTTRAACARSCAASSRRPAPTGPDPWSRHRAEAGHGPHTRPSPSSWKARSNSLNGRRRRHESRWRSRNGARWLRRPPGQADDHRSIRGRARRKRASSRCP